MAKKEAKAVLKILRRMLKLIPDRTCWTQCAPARSKKGKLLDYEDKRAVRFSLRGAWEKGADWYEIEDQIFEEDREQGVEELIPMLALRELCMTTLSFQHRGFYQFRRTPYTRPNVLSEFNDVAGRTHKQVLAVIEETIDRIERVGLRKPED